MPEIQDETAEELYETAPCGYLTTDISGRILKINKTLAEWLGADKADLTNGTRITDILTVGGRIFYETHLRLMLGMKDEIHEIALDIACRDGRVLPTLVNARQKRSPSGDPILNQYTIVNATERRAYERELLVARDLLRTTLSSIGDGVIATDAQQRITFINPVAERITEWPGNSALGKRIDEVLTLVREVDGGPVENPITAALRSGTTIMLQNHTALVLRDGRRVPIDDSASPIRDDAGETMGGVLVFRDISERRIVEKALAETHAQLKESAAKLRRSNEELSQFAHLASHDLRSPVNNVIQFSQLLERQHGDQIGDSGKELIAYLTDAGRRMLRLINDLLKYAEVSADLTTLPEPVDANMAVELATANLRGSIEQSGARITLGSLPAVRVDLTGMVRLFQNLIENAIHYRGTDPPLIHIDATGQAEHWLFSCKDNGIGIAAHFQQEIFQPFRRLHGVDRPGTGLGLAVCKKVVERYNGRIWVESQENVGTSFYFTLPKDTGDHAGRVTPLSV